MAGTWKLRIQLRRDTVANWERFDPVLLYGEAAFSSDINQLKIGDGKSKWSELEYVNNVNMAGFDGAEAGTYPVKQEDGSIKWIKPSELSSEGIQERLNAQDTKIAALQSASGTKVALDNVQLQPDEQGVVNIPTATSTRLGLVKSSSEENKVAIKDDGTMEVNSINVELLTQSENSKFILNGGNADTI